MKKILIKIVICSTIFGFMILFTIPFQSCDKKKDTVKPDSIKKDSVVVPVKVYEPYIYLYPQNEISLAVNITFPKGGKIVASIPSYSSGWDINVDSTGKINKKYDYLFYESEQPDEWQYTSGWIIKTDSLMIFFQQNMSEYGFNSKEIKDFVDYWVSRFNKYNYYLIYPQEESIIDKLIQVNYSIKPDNLLRLFYAIKGTNVLLKIDKHLIKTNFKRNGFYVAEWGVILK